MEVEVAAITETYIVIDAEQPTITEENKVEVTEDTVSEVTEINIAEITDTEGPSIIEVVETADQEEKIADTQLTENLETAPETVTITVTDVNIDTAVVDDEGSDAVTEATVEKNKGTETTETKELNIDDEVGPDLIGNMVYLAQLRNKNYFYSETFKVSNSINIY